MLIPFTSASFTNLSGLAVADGADVEVRLESNGALAALFDDRGGTTPLTNPFNADSQGRFAFYVAGVLDGYSVEVTKGAQTHILHHQLTGSAGAISFDQDGSGAVTRSLRAKVGEIEVSVNDYSSIQEAIDEWKPASETTPFASTVVIKIPDGEHEITAPINLYSGVKLRGTGEGSKIVQGAGFAGTALVLMKGQGANTFCSFSGVLDMGFRCAGATWAIKSNASFVLNSEFKNIFLDAGFGLDLGIYTQACVIDTVYAGGSSTNQILHLKGNHNKVFNIDKEGNTGSSTDPYILVEAHGAGESEGNLFDYILLEGTTSANKSLMKLSGCKGTHLDHLWFEPTSTDGYGLRILDCINTRIGQFGNTLVASTALKVDNSENTHIDAFDFDGDDIPLGDVLEHDATSDIYIGVSRDRRWKDILVLAEMGRNVVMDRVYSRAVFTDALTGYSPLQRAEWLCGQNLAINGSFEAGRYGWIISTTPTTTEEYIASEVGAGLMAHFLWASLQADVTFTQVVTVPANMPVTVTAKVKMAVGTGWISPFTEGVGITQTVGYHRVNTGTGWQIITRTVIPTSAGSLAVGLEFINATEVYVDEFSVAVGNVGVPNQAKYGTLEVGGKTIAFDSAAPTFGTWKAGDVVFNTGVAAGGTPGWSCTTSGSPGTWKAWANVAA